MRTSIKSAIALLLMNLVIFAGNGHVSAQETYYDPGQNGIWQYHLSSGSIIDIAITDNVVWVAAHRGLYKLRRDTMEVVDVIRYPGAGFPRSLTIGRRMAIDSQDHIWIIEPGTGVLRYDGWEWTTFAAGEGLISDYVTDIIADSQDNIWIAWNGDRDLGIDHPGISRWSGTGWETVAHSEFSETAISGISKIDISDESSIWMATSSRTVARLKGGELTEYPVGSISDIDAVTDTDVWASVSTTNGGGGLMHFDGSEWTYYSQGSRRGSVIVAADHRVWTTELQRGIAIFDGANWIEYDQRDGLSSNSIRLIRFAPDGTPFAIATVGGGDNGYPTQKGGLHSFDGNIWHHREINQSLHGDIQGAHVDASDRLWFVTDDGHLHVDRFGDGSWTEYPFPFEPLGRDHEISSVSPEGTLWLGTYHTTICGFLYCSGEHPLFSFDGSQWFEHGDELPTSNTLQDIAYQPGGITWLASGGGLIRSVDGVQQAFSKENGSLPGNDIHRIVPVSNGEVWIRGSDGTASGSPIFVRRFDGAQWHEFAGMTDEYPLGSDHLGHIWFSKYNQYSGSWLIELDGTTLTEHKPSDKPGSFPGLFLGAAPYVDGFGRLLFPLTNGRLVVYDGVNWFMQQFAAIYLPSVRELPLFTEDGRYWWWGTNGVAEFTPTPGITFSISGKAIAAGKELRNASVFLDGDLFTETDQNGNFVVYNLTPGRHTLSIEKTGYTFTPKTLNVTKSINSLEFVEGALPAISGRVTDMNGQALPQVRIDYQLGSVETDADGAYMINTLPDGMYTLTALKEGYTFFPNRIPVAVGPQTSGTADIIGKPNSSMPDYDPAKEPLLVIHGIQTMNVANIHGYSCDEGVTYLKDSTQSTLGELPAWFAESHNVYIAHLSSSMLHTPSLEYNADCLRDQISKIFSENSNRPVTIVAHSMGGVITRACLADPACRDKVKAVFTLGTPHVGINWGTVIKVILKLTEKYAHSNGVPIPLTEGICLWQEGFCELSTDQMLLFNLDSDYATHDGIQYTFIGGDVTPGWYGFTLRVSDGRNDGVVGRNSAVGWTYPFAIPAFDDQASTPVRYWTSEVHADIANVLVNFHEDGFAYYSPRGSSGKSYAFDCISYRMGPQTGSPPSWCRIASSNVTSAEATFNNTATTINIDGTLRAQQSASHTLSIDTAGQSQFTLAWLGGPLDFRLLQPDGVEITPTYVEANPDQVALSLITGGPGIPNMASYVFTTTVPGEWNVQIQNITSSTQTTAYLFYATLETERTLDIEVSSDRFAVGDTAVFTATLRGPSGGIAGATVTAEIDRTDGVTDTLTLQNIDGGIYRITYSVPDSLGITPLTVWASGTDIGTPFTREKATLFTINPVQTYTLSVGTIGNGTVSIDPEKPTYQSGEVVTLTAKPADGWRFLEWQGIPSETASAAVIIDKDLSITAVFEVIPSQTDAKVYLPIVAK